MFKNYEIMKIVNKLKKMVLPLTIAGATLTQMHATESTQRNYENPELPPFVPPSLENNLSFKIFSSDSDNKKRSFFIQTGLLKASKNSIGFSSNTPLTGNYDPDLTRYYANELSTPALSIGGGMDHKFNENFKLQVNARSIHSFDRTTDKKYSRLHINIGPEYINKLSNKTSFFSGLSLYYNRIFTKPPTPYSQAVDENGPIPWTTYYYGNIGSLGIQWNTGLKHKLSDNLILSTEIGGRHATKGFNETSHNFFTNIGLEYKIPTAEELRNREPRMKSARPQKRSRPTIQQTCPAHRQRHWERPPSVFNRVGN